MSDVTEATDAMTELDRRAHAATAALVDAAGSLPPRAAPRHRSGSWVAVVVSMVVLVGALGLLTRPVQPTVHRRNDLGVAAGAPPGTSARSVPAPDSSTLGAAAIVSFADATDAQRQRADAAVQRLIQRWPGTRDVRVIAFGGEGAGEWVAIAAWTPTIRTPEEYLVNISLGGAPQQPDCIADGFLRTDPAAPDDPKGTWRQGCHQPGSTGGGFSLWTDPAGRVILHGAVGAPVTRIDVLAHDVVLRSTTPLDHGADDPDGLRPWLVDVAGADTAQVVDGRGAVVQRIDLRHGVGPPRCSNGLDGCASAGG